VTQVDAAAAVRGKGQTPEPVTIAARLRRHIGGVAVHLTRRQASCPVPSPDPESEITAELGGATDVTFRMLRSGWYRIVVEFEIAADQPRISVARGRAFSRARSAGLSRIGTTTVYEGRFLARLPFDSIRLEWGYATAQARWTSITISMLGHHRRFPGLAGTALRRVEGRTAPFLSLWRDYPRLKRSRDFIDLRRFWPGPEETGDYHRWIEQFDYVDAYDRLPLARRIAALAPAPRISVLMPVHEASPAILDEAIRSVVDQVYPGWELCLAIDGSRSRRVHERLDHWAAHDGRIKVVHRVDDGAVCHANDALALATGEWIAMLDHRDVLAPNALAEIALAIAGRPQAALVYSDEDRIDDGGRRFYPHFKPDHSPELLRSMSYFGHLTVCRADHVHAAGGWRPGFEGAEDHDLVLRIVERIDPTRVVHVPKVLYHRRAVTGSAAASGPDTSDAVASGLRALQDHLARTAPDAQATRIPGLPLYRVRHAIRQPEPLVSLIIPTRDRVDLLRVAIGSILEKTTYRTFEIIVMDNNSEQEETFAYFEQIATLDNVRIVPHPHPFNHSAINNEAVRHARGEIVGLVNNDVEVIGPDWLGEMVSWAQLDRVGCVGAKLYYPGDTIQHAGVILGIGGVAGHAHRHLPRAEDGYVARARVVQNLSAVTGACLLVRRCVYEEVGGLDEVRFKVAFNDVDFCLRVREAGYDNVWTPFAELYHHESPSRGADDTPEKKARFDGEIAAMKERWPAQLAADPFYSPNLTIHAEDFGIRI
jgi:GT2 family glycosyltransferase